MQKKEKIHSRKIIIDTYETGEKAILVEGELSDERFFPFIVHATNETRGPGFVHHMKVSMVLSIPFLKIMSIEAEMPTVPVPDCLDIINSVKKLEGCYIKPGFTNQTKELLGNTQGCLHLTNLVLSMSSAAVQGVWSYFSRKRESSGEKMPATGGSLVINSCWMWREDGPFVQRIKKAMEEFKSAEVKTQ